MSLQWPVRRWRVPLALVFAMACAAAPAAGQGVLTQQEALRLAFPEPARIERRTAFLSEAQLDLAQRRAGAGVELPAKVLSYYVATRNGVPLGAAYFDVHRVRTLPEVVMIVVTPGGQIERIEILKFLEPPEYRAPAGWLGQIAGKRLDAGLSLKRGVAGMTGATLTSRAIVDASRRVLALHQAIAPMQETGTTQP